MNLVYVLLIVLLVLMIAGAPGFGPWQHNYGWGPTGGIGLVILILLVLLLVGRL